jgi:signal transduction histidine kinase/ActR/RegA family two-component response regulator
MKSGNLMKSKRVLLEIESVMTNTDNNMENTAQIPFNIVPGGEDKSTLSHIILNQFRNKLESARFYMPDDSPFCTAFENLEFSPPIHEYEFIGRSDWLMLAKMSGYAEGRLIIVFEECDIILSVYLKPDSAEKAVPSEKLEKFIFYLHTYLFRIIKGHMNYLAAINRISQVMLASVEIETIFPLLINELRNLFKFNIASLVTYHPEFDSFRVEAEFNGESEECNFKKQFLKLSETSLANLLTRKRGLVADEHDLGQGVLAQRMIRAGLHSFMLAPIFVNGELGACLILASRVMDGYVEDDLLRLNPICDIIGGALLASLNYSRLQQFSNDYNEARKNFLNLEKYRNFIDITRGVLHAFNNHLALIMGRAQILNQFSGETITRQAAEKGLNIILNASTRASEQIAQLQKYARLKPDDDPDQIQVKGLIEEIIDLSMPRWNSIAHGKIEFDVNIDSQIRFMGYRKKIKEVLINILMNSVEALKEDGGEITITSEIKEAMAIIRIRDNGIGIARDKISQVFNPFYSSKPNGTGLGLAVSYKIVREHNGNIQIESTPGKGTLVKISLPVEGREYATAEDNMQSRKIENAVLVATNRIQRNLIMRLLQKHGISVKAAKSLSAAEKMIVDSDPDLVILDDNIRDGNALEYFNIMKKSRPNIGTCLIGAPTDGEGLKQLYSMGVDALMVKPLEQGQVSNALHGLTKRHKCPEHRAE